MQYDNISEVYDKFNDDFDYEKYLNAVFRRFALRKEGLVLDCGCGTGVLMEKLTDLGYDCTGVDASENMLENARERFEKAGKQAHLVCQELEEIDMYGAYERRVLHARHSQPYTVAPRIENVFQKPFQFYRTGRKFCFRYQDKSGV